MSEPPTIRVLFAGEVVSSWLCTELTGWDVADLITTCHPTVSSHVAAGTELKPADLVLYDGNTKLSNRADLSCYQKGATFEVRLRDESRGGHTVAAEPSAPGAKSSHDNVTTSPKKPSKQPVRGGLPSASTPRTVAESKPAAGEATKRPKAPPPSTTTTTTTTPPVETQQRRRQQRSIGLMTKIEDPPPRVRSRSPSSEWAPKLVSDNEALSLLQHLSDGIAHSLRKETTKKSTDATAADKARLHAQQLVDDLERRAKKEQMSVDKIEEDARLTPIKPVCPIPSKASETKRTPTGRQLRSVAPCIAAACGNPPAQDASDEYPTFSPSAEAAHLAEIGMLNSHSLNNFEESVDSEEYQHTWLIDVQQMNFGATPPVQDDAADGLREVEEQHDEAKVDVDVVHEEHQEKDSSPLRSTSGPPSSSSSAAAQQDNADDVDMAQSSEAGCGARESSVDPDDSPRCSSLPESVGKPVEPPEPRADTSDRQTSAVADEKTPGPQVGDNPSSSPSDAGGETPQATGEGPKPTEYYEEF